MFISLEERLTSIFNSRHITLEWPKSPLSLPLRNSACSQSPNPELWYNSPSLSLHKTICLNFLQNSISKEQFTFPSSSSLHYTEKNTLFSTIFLMPLQWKSSLLLLSQPQLSSPLYRSHIYFFSLPQILGCLNSMKVSFFFPSSFRQVASKDAGAAKKSTKKSILPWTAGKNILELLLYLFFHLILS